MSPFDGYFSPQTYGGQAGGLLGLLRSFQETPQVQPSAGFTDGSYRMGDVQVPVFGQPEVTGQATLPPNATPTQGQLPQQSSMPQPSMGDRLSAGFQGFANNRGLLPALVGAAQGFSSGMTPENQTVKALTARGLDSETAQAVARDPVLLRAVLPQMLGVGGKSSDITEYEYAKRQGFGGSFAEWIQRKRSGAGEYGMTPIYGTDNEGKPVILQLGKSGEAVASKLPEGVKVSTGVEKVDLGTRWGLIDKRSGQVVGYEQKDIVGKESAEEVGKAQGQAKVNLPNVIANAEQTLKIIDSIKNDPYRERGTGLSSYFNAIPSTGGYDFAQKVEQLKGKSFLEAFQALKGGGAITEIEGKKAENAIARLSVGQSEGAFLQAIDELREVVTAGIERARQRAGVSNQAPTPAAPSSEGWTDVGGGVKIRRKQ